jgi:hypothetical protein
MAKLPGLTEYYATLGAPAINFGRGLLGYQDPVGTETMQNRMTEIEAGRTKGNVGYEEYGLTPSGGRMVGGLMDLAVNNPADFALAGSIGKYDFSPEGRTGLNYDFTPDQDTGSTGNAMLDYVNSGGVRNSLSNLRDSFSNMGSAQASEITRPQNLGFRSMVDMANDANNFDSQFSYPASQPQNLGFIESAAVPKEAIYQDRFMNNNLSNSNYEPRQGILQGLQDKMGAGFNNVKDFAIDKGRMGKNLLGSAGAMALGLPGIVGSGAMALMGGMGNAFEDRQLSGDGTTVDEYGRSYNASDLNKMNARGGYYTEAARSSRRRTNRINDMLARKAKGKRISAANLARLQAQEAAQEQARLTATKQMAQQNRQSGSGGYQSSFGGDSGFMDGSGTAAEMGSFKDGGLASMFTRRR